LIVASCGLRGSAAFSVSAGCGVLGQLRGVYCGLGAGKQTTWASKPAMKEYSRETSYIVNKYPPMPLLYFSL
jgi:hypothetical protein